MHEMSQRNPLYSNQKFNFKKKISLRRKWTNLCFSLKDNPPGGKEAILTEGRRQEGRVIRI